MAREKAPEPDTSGELPAWLMTYSDVITLMMTFFILLLTFSTTEKENFERLQVAMFSGGSSSGFAGRDKNNQDSMLYRERPRTARQTARGAEMPPMDEDPTLEALRKGLKSLEEEPRDPSSSRAMTMSLPLLVDSEGVITNRGKQTMRMLAIQLRRFPLSIRMQVTEDDEISHAIALALNLTEKQAILPGRIAVEKDEQGARGKIRMILSRPIRRRT